VLLLKNLLFTLVVPGTVAVYVPLLIAQDCSAASGSLFAVALAVLALGSAIYAWCVWDFATVGQGFCPWDGVLGVTAAALSPAAAEVACSAGVQASFAEASEKMLPKLAGLRLAESTVERTTEAVGLRLAAAQTAGQALEPPQVWAWHKDADGKTVAYVAVEATEVPQQGQDGAKAESRMANVAVIYNPVPDDPACWANSAAGREPRWQARYVASLERGPSWA
jgi:hypothetical protein